MADMLRTIWLFIVFLVAAACAARLGYQAGYGSGRNDGFSDGFDTARGSVRCIDSLSYRVPDEKDHDSGYWYSPETAGTEIYFDGRLAAIIGKAK